jgi:hypothetical protein
MDVIKWINDFRGTDWFVPSIYIDEDIILKFTDSRNYSVTIVCENYIGISFIGNWDEGIIDYICIEPKGDLIESSLKKIVGLYGDNPLHGYAERINANGYQ